MSLLEHFSIEHKITLLREYKNGMSLEKISSLYHVSKKAMIEMIRESLDV